MDNKQKKVDRRVVRTKKAICNAFSEIMTKKDISRITIKEIADLADVNRKTVYNYYDSVYDILDEIENCIVKDFEKVLKHLDFTCNYHNTYKVFETLTDLINSELTFYSNLTKMTSNIGLIVKLVDYLRGKIKDAFIAQQIFKDPSKVETAATFIVTGMMSCYKYWFESDQKVPLEEFSKDVSKLVTEGVNSLFK